MHQACLFMLYDIRLSPRQEVIPIADALAILRYLQSVVNDP